VRAINLIPAESRGGGAARSGGAAYVLLGVLALLVVGVAAYVLTSNKIEERQVQLATLQTQVDAAQQQAEARRPYREFAALAQARVETIRQLGAARFDWHDALSNLSKVVPENVWLTSLLGTVTTGVSVEGGSSGAAGSLRSALPNPAIELTGCTTSHEGVARLISRLRLIDGVERVSLADSSKGGAGGGSDCQHGHDQFPQFDLVVFFAPLPAVPSPPSASVSAAPASQTSANPTPAPSGPAGGRPSDQGNSPQ
jgi:Tfp pilus assembly protein PilN